MNLDNRQTNRDTISFMIEVFIDESGNMGRSGKYFVIAAVVCPNSSSKNRLKRIFKKSCLKYSSTKEPLKEIKASEQPFEHLQELSNKVAQKPDHELYIIVVEKKHYKTKLDNNLDYMYLSGFLIKRVLKKYNDDIRITFDARDVKATSLTSIADYLKIKAEMDWGFKHNLEVSRKESHTMYCLQAADLIAHISYRKYKDDRRHLFDIVSPRAEEVIKFPIGKFGK
jgi:hypothetical protein